MFRPWNYSTDGAEAEERWPLQAAQLAAHALKPFSPFSFFHVGSGPRASQRAIRVSLFSVIFLVGVLMGSCMVAWWRQE
jgi:hypothetical protein